MTSMVAEYPGERTECSPTDVVTSLIILSGISLSDVDMIATVAVNVLHKTGDA